VDVLKDAVAPVPAREQVSWSRQATLRRRQWLAPSAATGLMATAAARAEVQDVAI
jgi:hypothetical protein